MTTVIVMEHTVIAYGAEETQALKRNSSRGVLPELPALQSLIKILLSFACTCQLLTQSTACQQQRGGLRLSKEATNAAK